MRTERKTELWGFYTLRSVKAVSPEEAEKKAVQMICEDKKLTAVLDKAHPAEPKIYLEGMCELRWWSRLGGAGYTFYPMEENDS